jgi:hypothetical protein
VDGDHCILSGSAACVVHAARRRAAGRFAMPWRMVAREWLEIIKIAPPPSTEDDDSDFEDMEKGAVRPPSYEPLRCGECGESRMLHPRATVCCGEILCATCARGAIEVQQGPSEGFICPFCGAAMGASQRRLIDQALQQFGEEGYLELLGINPDDRSFNKSTYGRYHHPFF